MFNLILTGDHQNGKKAFQLAVADDVFDGAFLCCLFPARFLG